MEQERDVLGVKLGDEEVGGGMGGSVGYGGMRERRRAGSAQEGFQLRSLHSDLIWPVCLGCMSPGASTPPPVPSQTPDTVEKPGEA